jgi:transposase
MSITSSKDGCRVEVITSVQRHRRFTSEEKLLMIEEAEQPGMTVSYVARKYNVAANQLFKWRKLERFA